MSYVREVKAKQSNQHVAMPRVVHIRESDKAWDRDC